MKIKAVIRLKFLGGINEDGAVSAKSHTKWGDLGCAICVHWRDGGQPLSFFHAFVHIFRAIGK